MKRAGVFVIVRAARARSRHGGVCAEFGGIEDIGFRGWAIIPLHFCCLFVCFCCLIVCCSFVCFCCLLFVVCLFVCLFVFHVLNHPPRPLPPPAIPSLQSLKYGDLSVNTNPCVWLRCPCVALR